MSEENNARLARIETALDFIKEKLDKIDDKVSSFDHCTTTLEVKLESHLQEHEKSGSWKRRVLLALVGVATSVALSVLSLLL